MIWAVVWQFYFEFLEKVKLWNVFFGDSSDSVFRSVVFVHNIVVHVVGTNATGYPLRDKSFLRSSKADCNRLGDEQMRRHRVRIRLTLYFRANRFILLMMYLEAYETLSSQINVFTTCVVLLCLWPQFVFYFLHLLFRRMFFPISFFDLSRFRFTMFFLASCLSGSFLLFAI